MSSSNVLLIDDNNLDHKIFNHYAKSTDRIKLTSVESIDDGMYSIVEKNPDVILLDNCLQPFDTFKDTVPQLRAFGYSGRIIVISSDISSINQKDLDDYTVDKCVSKVDFDYNNFEDKVSDLIAA
jgi:response regulator of citrate/malate metabolism